MHELYALLFLIGGKAAAARRARDPEAENRFYCDNAEPGWWWLFSIGRKAAQARVGAIKKNE